MSILPTGRNVRLLLMLPTLLLSTFTVLGAFPAVYATPNMYVQPALINDKCPGSPAVCTHDIGAVFNYTVSVSGIGGAPGTVFAYQLELHYNPSLMQATNVPSFGTFWDALLGLGFALPVTSIDNTNGVVTIAVTSLGPSTLSSTTAMDLAIVTFSVTALGRSDMTLANTILLHNAGGGNLVNLPMTTTNGVFSNTQLYGLASFPIPGSGVQQAYGEAKRWSFSGDNVFTPGCLDLYGNANSTGTLPVLVKIQFTVTSSYGTLVLNTPSTTLDAGYPSGAPTVVPLHTCFTPLSGSGAVQVGNYHVHAVVVYQQINLDNSLGPVSFSNQKTFTLKVAL